MTAMLRFVMRLRFAATFALALASVVGCTSGSRVEPDGGSATTGAAPTSETTITATSDTNDGITNTTPTVPTATTARAASTVCTTPTSTLTPHLTPPGPLRSPAAVPAPGEGIWKPLGPTVGGIQGAYTTLIRPDATNTAFFDAVVWFDPTILCLRQYPGLKIPGAPWDRPPFVEPEHQTQLVAAFSAGFRIQDSRGGMILGQQTLSPMINGKATLAIDQNGVPKIGAWGTDITATQNLDSARQNLELIVINAMPATELATDPNAHWGFTGPRNKPAVWRSGIGIRADGSIVWVGGDRLSVETLAETLVRAGAITGMQLEINKPWVQLNTYAANADGRVHGTKLLTGMQHTGDRWLTEDSRDFIAVFIRPT